MSKEDQQQKQKLLHESVDDWVSDPRFAGCDYSASLNKYWCPVHLKCLDASQMTNHFKGHKEEIEPGSDEANKILKNISKSEKPTEDHTRIPTPHEMILEDINRQVAEAVSMLGHDWELRAEFEFLKLKMTIPWDWSFYDWIKMTVTFWNKKWGYDLKMLLDESKLDDEQKAWLREVIAENMTHQKQVEAASEDSS